MAARELIVQVVSNSVSVLQMVLGEVDKVMTVPQEYPLRDLESFLDGKINPAAALSPSYYF